MGNNELQSNLGWVNFSKKQVLICFVKNSRIKKDNIQLPVQRKFFSTGEAEAF